MWAEALTGTRVALSSTSMSLASLASSLGCAMLRGSILALRFSCALTDSSLPCSRFLLRLFLRAQTLASSHSNYAVCINTSGPRVVAMSGVGAQVDVFISLRYKAFSLDFF